PRFVSTRALPGYVKQNRHSRDESACITRRGGGRRSARRYPGSSALDFIPVMPARTNMIRHRSGCSAQDARSPIGSVAGRQPLWRRAALLATSAFASVALASVGRAQDGTWLANPATGDFNTAGNWSSNVVPTGT